MTHPTDLESHKYREEPKFCLFNVDSNPSKKQIKIDELDNEKLLRLWHGNNNSKSAR